MGKDDKKFSIGFVVPPEPPPRKIRNVEQMFRRLMDETPHENRDYKRVESIALKFVFDPDPQYPIQ